MTSDQVITNRERVTFFLRHSVDDLKWPLNIFWHL